jgi:RimJ/RimL family protein N-acetyltransferase
MTQVRSDIPVLQTERLVLRGAQNADFDAFAEMMADPRTSYMGGPFTRLDAWGEFTKAIASWHLDGFGGWIILAREDDRFCGEVAVLRPPHYPEAELGWTLAGAAEGKGYACEAARAALAWYWDNTDAPTLVSYITPGNTRSEALAAKLGAWPDTGAALPEGETADETTVYRHTRPAMKARVQ